MRRRQRQPVDAVPWSGCAPASSPGRPARCEAADREGPDLSGIVIAATASALAATLLYGGVLWRLSPAAERSLLVACFVLELPMSAATFHFVRAPAIAWLQGALGDQALLDWLRLSFAPLTEEPAKLWPLLLPWIAGRVTADNAARVAVALGLGFGVGEIGFLASVIGAVPGNDALPWTQFGAFFAERLQVCLVHGLFTAIAVLGWRRWGIGLAAGLGLGMLLHALGNLPILLSGAGWLGPGAVAGTVLALWVPGFWIAAIVTFTRLDPRLRELARARALVTCPKCGAVHRRSRLALNVGLRRLERCPACGRWSLV